MYRRFAIEHAGLYALTQATLKHGSNAQQAEALRAVKVFEAVVKSYGVPDDLSVHAIRMVRAGLQGFSDIESHGGFQMSQSLADSFLFLVDAIHTARSKLGEAALKADACRAPKGNAGVIRCYRFCRTDQVARCEPTFATII
ncbi:TetR-like C-terminal domain-containing protein [Lichenifustis flavocetrariae]|uniref:WHG domain-containing protein n=1 Tax=Lichenifustis flavocetrariae TaxID=2949735 RepID=A0AA42CNG4_9HYPH|nr:WHG domain-containing protein [Lichenifustis flavocetrariae]